MIGETVVTVIQVTTTTDDLGDTTVESVEQEVGGVMFEPKQGVERTDPQSPGVVTPAKFYLPIPLQLDADDVIVDADGVWWSVTAGSSVWHDQTEVAVTRASVV